MIKQWYVLHVLTGCEPEVRRQLDDRGFVALVPTESRMIRSGGRWQQKEYRLFPGYVFVLMTYGPANHHIVHSIPGVIRVLPKEKPVPLTPRESAWIMEIGGATLAPSRVDFSGEKPVVVDGPLRQFSDRIVKFNRHRQRALINLPVLGEPKQIELSIIPV